jgi:hypothetical protein
VAVFRVLINGTVPPPAVAPPPPAVPPAPPPPQLPPASAGPQFDPALLAAAGVTLAQAQAADAAATAAAAGAAALLAGQGSAGIAAAEQAAGAPDDVVAGLLALGLPDLTNLVVGGTDGSGDSVGDTDDLDAAAALANANAPDLSGLGDVQVDDLFDARTLAASNPPLKGGSAVAAIAQACSDYGVDALATVADALHEGANGGIGDNGTSYGPFQMHIGGRLPQPYSSHGANNPTTNAWAWTENGIRYAIRDACLIRPSVKGLRGHASVYAWVYGFESPGDKPGQYKVRAAEYDHLVSLGSGWAAYAAAKFAGPQSGGGVDSAPLTVPSSTAYKPAGVVAQWRDFVNVFRLTVPKQHANAKAWSSALVEVFK